MSSLSITSVNNASRTNNTTARITYNFLFTSPASDEGKLLTGSVNFKITNMNGVVSQITKSDISVRLVRETLLYESSAYAEFSYIHTITDDDGYNAVNRTVAIESTSLFINGVLAYPTISTTKVSANLPQYSVVAPVFNNLSFKLSGTAIAGNSNIIAKPSDTASIISHWNNLGSAYCKNFKLGEIMPQLVLAENTSSWSTNCLFGDRNSRAYSGNETTENSCKIDQMARSISGDLRGKVFIPGVYNYKYAGYSKHNGTQDTSATSYVGFQYINNIGVKINTLPIITDFGGRSIQYNESADFGTVTVTNNDSDTYLQKTAIFYSFIGDFSDKQRLSDWSSGSSVTFSNLTLPATTIAGAQTIYLRAYDGSDDNDICEASSEIITVNLTRAIPGVRIKVEPISSEDNGIRECDVYIYDGTEAKICDPYIMTSGQVKEVLL